MGRLLHSPEILKIQLRYDGIYRVPQIQIRLPEHSKAGCTSVKNWIYRLENGHYLNEPLDIHKVERSHLVHFDTNRSQVYEAFRSSFVFTMVRRPLKRAYSLFTEKILQQSQYAFGGVRRKLKDQYGASLQTGSLEECQSDFLAFLNFVRDTQRNKVDFRLG